MYKLSKINTQLIIKSIASVVLTVMLICIAVISFCIYSNSGFSYLIKAVSFYYDKEIIISKSSGTLANGIIIKQAVITDHNLKINLTNMSLQHSLQHLLDIPQLNIEKMLLSYGALNTTITDIKITKDSAVNNNISFKIPKYNIYSRTDLIKHNSEYKILTNLNFKDSNFTLIGTTNKQSLTLKNNPKSAINTNIKVSWHDMLNWDITANNNIKNDNLQNLDFYSSGTQNDFIFALNKLQGVIAESPINASLIYKKHNALQSLLADIAYSNSKAKINFRMADNIFFKANINAPDLSEIMPELLGSIAAEIDIAGTTTKPEAKITLNANNIFQSNISIDKLVTDISFNENGSNNINANIIASGTRYKNIYKKQSSIHVSGNLDKHTISIQSEKTASDPNLMSLIEGSYDNQAWSAKIIKLALNNKHSKLALAKPDTITISNNQINNNNLCLAHEDQTICAKLMLNTNNFSWQAHVNSDHFDLENLSNLNFLSNLITIRSGSIAGDMTINANKKGTISPHGYFNIKDAQLYLKEQNIYPTLSSFSIKSKEHTSTIIGEIISENNNTAKISGYIKTNNPFEAKIKIKGKELLINNTKSIRLIASPDITLFLNNYLNITGNIDIPQAKFNIQNNDEVKLPNDIIIANYYDKTKSKFMVLGPKTALHLNLLDNISIEMQKIYSKITGSLLLNANSDGEILATGTIKAYDGSFSGYGHKLDIENGKLIYDKEPLDSPSLNIEATRSINLDSNADIRSLEKIIVGIVISGNIASPSITLFSNPNKYTENEILSLLLTGSLSSMINDDSAADKQSDNFYSMLLGKNLIQSLGVLNQLSDELSLNQITIGGSINDNQTSINTQSPLNITMSKDINDKLRLVGTFGIYSEGYSLSAIYSINKNIMLKGYVNQLSNGLNMLYKFTTN
jgi:autotransporter translocation and assembly factor TamB